MLNGFPYLGGPKVTGVLPSATSAGGTALTPAGMDYIILMAL